MSHNLAHLCVALVNHHLGEVAARIFAYLAGRGRQTAAALSVAVDAPLRILEPALASLIEEQVLLHHTPEGEKYPYFSVNWRHAYHIARHQNVVALVTDRYGHGAGRIVRTVLRLGQARVGDLLENVNSNPAVPANTSFDEEGEFVETDAAVKEARGADAEEGDTEESGVGADDAGEGVPETNNDEETAVGGEGLDEDGVTNGVHIEMPPSLDQSEFQELLGKLLKSGILVKVVERMFMPAADLQEEIEERVILEQFPDRKITGPRKSVEFAEAVNELKHKWQEEDQFNGLHDYESKGAVKRPMDRQADNGPPNKRVKLNAEIPNGVHADDNLTPRVEGELVVRVDFARCTLAMRNQLLGKMAKNLLGESTGAVYDAALQVIERKDRTPSTQIKKVKNDGIDNDGDPDKDDADNERADDEDADEEPIDDKQSDDERSDDERVEDEAADDESVKDDPTDNENLDNERAQYKRNHTASFQQEASCFLHEIAEILDPTVELRFLKEEDPTNPHPHPHASRKRGKKPHGDYDDSGIKLEHSSDSEDNDQEFEDEDRGTPLDLAVNGLESKASNVKRKALLAQHLGILEEHPYGFVRKGQSGIPNCDEWIINFTKVSKHLIDNELDALVLSRFPHTHLRIVHIVREHGKIDEKLIGTLAMIRPRPLRAYLTQLQYAGFLDVQEIAKDNSRQASNCSYLWFFDADRVRSVMLQNTYKTMTRLLQRLQVEKKRYNEVIRKSQRLDIVGQEEEKLSPADLNVLNKWRTVEEMLLAQVARCDELVICLRDACSGGPEGEGLDV